MLGWVGAVLVWLGCRQVSRDLVSVHWLAVRPGDFLAWWVLILVWCGRSRAGQGLFLWMLDYMLAHSLLLALDRRMTSRRVGMCQLHYCHALIRLYLIAKSAFFLHQFNVWRCWVDAGVGDFAIKGVIIISCNVASQLAESTLSRWFNGVGTPDFASSDAVSYVYFFVAGCTKKWLCLGRISFLWGFICLPCPYSS